MPAQNIPAMAIIVLCVAGIGAVPYGVQKLFHGETREVGRDVFDYNMELRDKRLAAAMAARKQT